MKENPIELERETIVTERAHGFITRRANAIARFAVELFGRPSVNGPAERGVAQFVGRDRARRGAHVFVF